MTTCRKVQFKVRKKEEGNSWSRSKRDRVSFIILLRVGCRPAEDFSAVEMRDRGMHWHWYGYACDHWRHSDACSQCAECARGNQPSHSVRDSGLLHAWLLAVRIMDMGDSPALKTHLTMLTDAPVFSTLYPYVNITSRGVHAPWDTDSALQRAWPSPATAAPRDSLSLTTARLYTASKSEKYQVLKWTSHW